MMNRAFGPYGWVFWVLMLFNVLVPQALWSARIGVTRSLLFIVALFINVGMWIERFVIVITSLNRDFTPSMWNMFFPTHLGLDDLFGSVSLFLTLSFLFIRLVPDDFDFRNARTDCRTGKSERAMRRVTV